MRPLLILILAVTANAAPVPKAAQIVNLDGTVWTGSADWNNVGRFDIVIKFESHHSFILTRNGQSYNGKWERAGSDVKLRTQPGSVYELTMTGETMNGKALGHVPDTYAAVTLKRKRD